MEQEEKLLLLGPGGAGKTCMRSIIFENYFPRDALRLGITISMDQNRVHILRNLFLNLLDGGGQQQYVLEYLNKQREYIFRKVAVMLFVFDICSFSMKEPPDSKRQITYNSWTKKEMLHYFEQTMYSLHTYSPKAKVFVLLHKIDLIKPEFREQRFLESKLEVLHVIQEMQNGSEEPNAFDIQFFCTSIWTNSLYRAYSSVVRSLIPNRHRLVEAIQRLGHACRAKEVALYERSTFLCLAHVTRRESSSKEASSEGELNSEPTNILELPPVEGDLHTAQVSETVKHFKLSCMNNGASLDGFTIETEDFTAILTPFTPYVHILLVCDDPSVSPALHKININIARNQFQTFLKSSDPEAAAMRTVL